VGPTMVGREGESEVSEVVQVELRNECLFLNQATSGGGSFAKSAKKIRIMSSFGSSR